MSKKTVPDFVEGMSYAEAASLCHLITTQNGHARRLSEEGKPTLSEHCETTRRFYEKLIAYVDKWS